MNKYSKFDKLEVEWTLQIKTTTSYQGKYIKNLIRIKRNRRKSRRHKKANIVLNKVTK